MEAMFSGFDGGGWWLVVVGSRGAQRSPGLAERHPNSGWSWLPWGREKGERKWSFWVELYFLTNQLVLTEFLTTK